MDSLVGNDVSVMCCLCAKVILFFTCDMIFENAPLPAVLLSHINNYGLPSRSGRKVMSL